MRTVSALCILIISTGFVLAGEPDARVQTILDENGVIYDISEEGDFLVTYDLGDDRSQMALINSVTNTFENLEVREIYSMGYDSESGTIPENIANLMLVHSYESVLGAWGNLDGSGLFIVRVDANAGAGEFLSSLMICLRRADDLEKQIYGIAQDDY